MYQSAQPRTKSASSHLCKFTCGLTDQEAPPQSWRVKRRLGCHGQSRRCAREPRYTSIYHWRLMYGGDIFEGMNIHEIWCSPADYSGFEPFPYFLTYAIVHESCIYIACAITYACMYIYIYMYFWYLDLYIYLFIYLLFYFFLYIVESVNKFK